MKGVMCNKVKDTLGKWRKTLHRKLIIQKFRTKSRRNHR